MSRTIHPKILEAKRRAAAINYRSLELNAAGELVETGKLLDQRIIAGYAVIWGRRNLHGEKQLKGAWTKTIQERGPQSNSNYKLKLMGLNHDWDNVLANLAVIEERELGLYFESEPLPAGDYEDSVLLKVQDKRVNSFSCGFNPIWDKVDYEETTDSLILKEVEGYEISPVTIPSDMGTFAVRGMEAEAEDLNEEVEFFIKDLPRKHQLEARHLFARHKALINAKPPMQQREALGNNNEPRTGRVNVDYILNNLKF